MLTQNYTLTDNILFTIISVCWNFIATNFTRIRFWIEYSSISNTNKFNSEHIWLQFNEMCQIEEIEKICKIIKTIISKISLILRD